MKKNLLYAFGAGVLFLAYLLILLAGLDIKKASYEYRMFYLTHELKYKVPDYTLDSYVTDKLWFYGKNGNYKNQGDGFDFPEADGTWCVGNDSHMYFYCNHPEDAFTVEIVCAENLNYPCNLYLNGRDYGPLVFDGDTARVEIDAYRVYWGNNDLCIHTDAEVKPYDDLNPESTDSRALNLKIKSVMIKTKEE